MRRYNSSGPDEESYSFHESRLLHIEWFSFLNDMDYFGFTGAELRDIRIKLHRSMDLDG